MKQLTLGVALVVGLVFAAGTPANGVIIAKGEPAQKHRKDIDKQTAKLAICMGKAALACEEAGVSDAAECDLSDPPMSTVPDPDMDTPENEAIDDLVADLTKCESKLNLTKKGNDYTALGCPGDSVPGGADDPFADFASYAAGVPDATIAQLELLQGVLDGICADSACTLEQGELGVAYAKAIFKCITKCENDYKNKKGDGGNTDAVINCDPATSTDTGFQECRTKAASKAPGIQGPFKSALESAISDGRDDLYNEDDCP
jgi:hypothetical protein